MTENPLRWLSVSKEATLLEIIKCQADAPKRDLPSGIVIVLDEEGRAVGTVTDGDIRRAILRHGSLEGTAADAMTRDPILFPDGLSFQEILDALPGELTRRGRRSHIFLGKIVLVDEQQRPTRVLEYHELWEQRVATHRHIVVVGMGYVGLTLSLTLADEGFRVTGVEASPPIAAGLSKGETHVHEVGLTELLREQLLRNFSISTTLPEDGDVFVIAVGTPIEESHGKHTPDLRALESATRQVGARLKRGGLVILRSTVPIGCTRRVVCSILNETSSLRAGVDYHIAFAPERTTEGNALSELRSLPQVVGGINGDSVEAAVAIFRELTPTIVRVDSLETAEMVKLLNNGFRDVVFAFANEMSQVAARYNVNVFDAIEAANRGYPRDPIPLPSPGVGGPCLTKDPYILASAHPEPTQSLSTRGRTVNESMHDFVVTSLLNQLNTLGKNSKTSTVFICGLAFKGQPETADLRDSSSVVIAKTLLPLVGRVLAHDPVASVQSIVDLGLEFSDPDSVARADAVLLLNNHRIYKNLDIARLVRTLTPPGIVFDAWNMHRPEDVLRATPCVYMTLGYSASSVAT